MKRLLSQLEAERKKLNQLGIESLEQGIPLAENKAVQAQSRKIDQLIVRLNKKNAGRGQHQR
ncbi:aspartyl-phosphate phosphatase Spo0E family protein [Paenibacillus agaridevorans]|uniref:aspartyl-phosphate phosphatase Spo0E family protein n=1 Tax=Paenibacillus agaridevorans TaxID=171404 RepID=UPI001BE4C4F7|nr:aspartyl-phosphate phosphatase Spo0E family protein [Paenibacillus agaridevorans]